MHAVCRQYLWSGTLSSQALLQDSSHGGVRGRGGEVIVGGEELVEYFQYLKGWSG